MALEESTETIEAAATMTSPFCGELRSKKFFMSNGGLLTEAAQYLDGSNHCWCFQTQQVIGPDGGKVTPFRCTPERTCYRSII